ERALEDKLAAVRRAETDLAAQRARRPVTLTDEEIAFLNRAAADVRAIFDAPTTSIRERKQLIAPSSRRSDSPSTANKDSPSYASCGRVVSSLSCRCQ